MHTHCNFIVLPHWNSRPSAPWSDIPHYPDIASTSPCPIIIITSTWLGSGKYKLKSHLFDLARVRTCNVWIPRSSKMWGGCSSHSAISSGHYWIKLNAPSGGLAGHYYCQSRPEWSTVPQGTGCHGYGSDTWYLIPDHRCRMRRGENDWWPVSGWSATYREYETTHQWNFCTGNQPFK